MSKRARRISQDELDAWDRHLSEGYGQMKALFKIKEVCEILDCSRMTVDSLRKKRKLAIVEVGSSPRITRLSLLEYLARRPASAARPRSNDAAQA
jgi:excisionase family DNA binding protein